jgi:signal transduction histidine kinase
MVSSWPKDSVTMPDDSIWLAYDDALRRLKDGVITVYHTQNGLVNNDVQTLTVDTNGGLWIATQGGISFWKDDKFHNCTSTNGLYADNVRAIVADDLGNLWMSSGRGIFSVTRSGLEEFFSGRSPRVNCAVYAGSDVVKSTERGTGQRDNGCKTTDGRVWFPFGKGLVMIDPSHLRTNMVAPPVDIYAVTVNGVRVTDESHPVVRPGKGDLEFRFAALTYVAPQKVRFRYRLEGYDADWVEVQGRREAYYTNLKPGSYRFRVLACNADGVWNQTGASYSVEIPPHFYQTAWFKVLCVGFLAGMSIIFYQWKVRQYRRKQEELQKANELLETRVKERTAELARANVSLSDEVEEHKRTEVKLEEKTRMLEDEIEERKRLEAEKENTHKELMDISRRAGMAEVATGVLHNVGNVLNSVNVSATLITEKVRRSKSGNVARVAALINEHIDDLGNFMTQDEKGRKLPNYLNLLAEGINSEQQDIQTELASLRGNIEHIREIVNMQQDYARISGVKETMPVKDLVDDALKMHSGAYLRHAVQLTREYEDVPMITTDKHKVLQILVNIFHNAKYACDASGRTDKCVNVRISSCGENRVKISVTDNGIGIPPENLNRIFTHGFTTRKTGHGFGLHSGALAAKEIGGILTAQSDGTGQGATFHLELPMSCD